MLTLSQTKKSSKLPGKKSKVGFHQQRSQEESEAFGGVVSLTMLVCDGQEKSVEFIYQTFVS